MTYDEYVAISSEIKQLESLLSEIPEKNYIERISLESRLASARGAIANVTSYQLVQKARLTFRGRPVFGSHGIAADFATKAASAFTDVVSAVAVGLTENLRYMGPIPDKQKNQLLITGTAIGSFGFEFELPQPVGDGWFPVPSKAENALGKVQELFRLAAEGNDDEIAEIVDEIHPRAVRKASDFLNFISQQEACCGLEFKGKFFKYQDIDQLQTSAARLREDNIRETEEVFVGELQGVLPTSRTFEFKLDDGKTILKGKIGSDIEDADTLNLNYLHIPISIKLHIIQVGQGRPRYTLQSLDHIITKSAGLLI